VWLERLGDRKLKKVVLRERQAEGQILKWIVQIVLCFGSEMRPFHVQH
jgi:hypothetical protein